jgi:hypothetical protein
MALDPENEPLQSLLVATTAARDDAKAMSLEQTPGVGGAAEVENETSLPAKRVPCALRERVTEVRNRWPEEDQKQPR